MLTKAKQVLADGVRIEDLIDVERREVALRVMSDREIYDVELERVFARTWVLLGHESEIPGAGDYMVRWIGEDSVIVARDRENAIHVSLNVCPHRGMRIALGEYGNAQTHRCIYHGWAFKPNGDFIGAPVEREQMHGDVCSKAELGLKQARVTVYGGLVFATWNIDGPSLEEHLGDIKWYLDMLFCRTDSGLEVLGPPQRMLMQANWKTAGEQSACDGFHTLTLHRSLLEMGQIGGDSDTIYDKAPAMYGVNVSANGHSLRCIPAEVTFSMVMGMSVDGLGVEERLKILPPPGITQELLPQVKAHLSKSQVDLLAKAPPQVGGLFPNVTIAFLYMPLDDGTMGSALVLHTFVPKGPDRFENYNWIFAEKDVSPEIKRKMLATSIRATGTSGTIEQDDADTWPQISLNARGAMGRHNTLKYQALLGEKKPENWPGGGKVYDGFSKDDAQWEWWLAYRRLMNAGA